MKANFFIARLDGIRSLARSSIGMGEAAVPKDHAVVKELQALIADLQSEVTTKRTIEVEMDAAGNTVLTPELQALVQHNAGETRLPLPGTDNEPTEAMKTVVIPRDPATKPSKVIVTEAADAKSVADRDLLATLGD